MGRQTGGIDARSNDQVSLAIDETLCCSETQPNGLSFRDSLRPKRVPLSKDSHRSIRDKRSSNGNGLLTENQGSIEADIQGNKLKATPNPLPTISSQTSSWLWSAASQTLFSLGIQQSLGFDQQQQDNEELSRLSAEEKLNRILEASIVKARKMQVFGVSEERQRILITATLQDAVMSKIRLTTDLLDHAEVFASPPLECIAMASSTCADSKNQEYSPSSSWTANMSPGNWLSSAFSAASNPKPMTLRTKRKESLSSQTTLFTSREEDMTNAFANILNQAINDAGLSRMVKIGLEIPRYAGDIPRVRLPVQMRRGRLSQRAVQRTSRLGVVGKDLTSSSSCS